MAEEIPLYFIPLHYLVARNAVSRITGIQSSPTSSPPFDLLVIFVPMETLVYTYMSERDVQWTFRKHLHADT